MKMKWFSEDIMTVDELRKSYRKLLKKFHPDNESGSVEATQEINEEYDRLFTILDSTDGSAVNQNTKKDDMAFKAVLNEIINFDMTIEIIGDWIWCFEAFAYKDRLKELGFKWAAKRRAWVWHEEEYQRYHKKEIPLSHIKQKYGCMTIKQETGQNKGDKRVLNGH